MDKKRLRIWHNLRLSFRKTTLDIFNQKFPLWRRIVPFQTPEYLLLCPLRSPHLLLSEVAWTHLRPTQPPPLQVLPPPLCHPRWCLCFFDWPLFLVLLRRCFLGKYFFGLNLKRTRCQSANMIDLLLQKDFLNFFYLSLAPFVFLNRGMKFGSSEGSSTEWYARSSTGTPRCLSIVVKSFWSPSSTVEEPGIFTKLSDPVVSPLRSPVVSEGWPRKRHLVVFSTVLMS